MEWNDLALFETCGPHRQSDPKMENQEFEGGRCMTELVFR